MSDDNKAQHHQLATSEERLWSGISLILSITSLLAAFSIEIAHGSTQWQATFIVAFVGYLFAAMAIGGKSFNSLVEDDGEENKNQREK